MPPCRESRFPDRGRKQTFPFASTLMHIVEKVDSPIGDENVLMEHVNRKGSDVEKVDSPIGDENCFPYCTYIVPQVCRESRFPDRGRKLHNQLF